MNYFRAILSGALVWLCVILSFYIVEQLPLTKNSIDTQGLVVLILIPFYAAAGAWFYYKNNNTAYALQLALIMTLTALLLDVLITVPLVEVPKGSSYHSFFTNPLLWALALLNMVSIFIYGKLKGLK